jgi:hypothetical protein
MTEQDRSLSGDELAFARTFIAQIEPRFTFASTVPEHPHWYVARAWLGADQQRDFDRLVQLIDSTCYTTHFWARAGRTSTSMAGPSGVPRAGTALTRASRRRCSTGVGWTAASFDWRPSDERPLAQRLHVRGRGRGRADRRVRPGHHGRRAEHRDHLRVPQHQPAAERWMRLERHQAIELAEAILHRFGGTDPSLY